MQKFKWCLREIGEKDQEYYYRDRKIEKEDLEEEARLRDDIPNKTEMSH